MKPTRLNGSHRANGPKLPSWNASNNSIQTSRCSQSAPNHDVVALFHYRAQRRRARAVAKAHARSRRIMTIGMMVLIAGSFISCTYTLHREQQLKQQEMQQQEQFKP